MAAKTNILARRTKEKTGTQARHTILQGGSVAWACGLGYPDPFPGTYPNYRRMSSNPTLALGKAVKTAPLLAASIGWQSKDGIPGVAAIQDFVQATLEPMYPFILNDMMFALDMGNQTFEKVWDVHRSTKPGLPATRIVYRKLKPLLQEMTTVLVDKDDGGFAGVKNGKAILAPDDCFHYVYDMRAGDWYGRSLHENCRREFCDFDEETKETQKLVKKLSGIVAVAKILKGMAKDENGADIDRYEAMKAVIAGLAQAKGVVFESVAASIDDLRADPSLLKVSDVDIDVLDLGTSSPALATLLAKRADYRSEFMQAWLLPPRAALEGSHGTLAEAEAHANIGITHSELIYRHAITFFNWYVVDPLLAVNFGEEYRGAVYAVPAPLVDEKKAVLKQILAAILANPGTLEMALGEFDTSAIYETMDIPIAEVPNEGEPVTTTPDTVVPVDAAAAITRTFVNAEP